MLTSLSAVKAVASEPIRVIYDALSNADVQIAAYDLLAPGGVFVNCRRIPTIPQEKRVEGKTVTLVFGSPSRQDFRPLGVSMWKHISALFESGDLKPNNVEVIPGGLGGIPAGLQKLKNGEVSAKKLVVHPNEIV
ncbi:hypothetical protein NM688_g1313 [Phlebia brevispora]|uniref:Uncharacterized protein n=1 Tax=Phlebia brevispora TaxID=194682 RepID=A0ACC1TBI6_9APHY|nr:hypothetical protein NM688_g1313 [Phlebia brevispora]